MGTSVAAARATAAAAHPPAGAPPVALRWPVPPYLDGSGAPANGRCVVELMDGDVRGDRRLAALPDASGIGIVEEGAIRALPWDLIRCIRALWALPAKEAPEGATAVDPRLSSRLLPVRIEWKDGRYVGGHTRGYSTDANALYLFMGEGSGPVTPWVLPRATLARVRFGDGQAESGTQAAEPAPEAAPPGAAIATRPELERALGHRQDVPPARVGDLLVAQGLVKPEQLEQALEVQTREPRRLIGDILVELGAVERPALLRAIGGQLGIPYVDATKFPVEAEAVSLVPRQVAAHYEVLPLFTKGHVLVVALADPFRKDVVEMLRFLTEHSVVAVMGSQPDIAARLAAELHAAVAPRAVAPPGEGRAAGGFGGGTDDIHDLAQLVAASPAALDEKPEAMVDSDNPLVKLVTRIIMDAYEQGVSDIHVETREDEDRTLFRFRRDGVMVDYLELPGVASRAVMSRIKIMSRLDISERRHPQDGKIPFEQFGPVKMDLRVAIIPTSNGAEDAVLRLLSASKPLPLQKLGLAERQLEQLKKVAERTYGLILICGPTGSGKTTTLHSVLAHINTPELKIWTAEDPIEIRQVGLRQVQVNAKIGFTFAAAMRSFLRADPDVIMVGEMRDEETTRIGIEASLTGHLVFSTLHTNSAAESIVRLLDLGMDPFNFADALLAILSQRLARRLCGKCKKPRDATEEEIAALAAEYGGGDDALAERARERWKKDFADRPIRLCEPVGCSACGGKGYKGRVGLYELLIASPRVKALVQARGRVSEILKVGLEEGMCTLKQDGIDKVVEGVTDLRSVKAAAE